MGAATAGRATAPNGIVTQEPYRNREEKRKAGREAALAACLAGRKQCNALVQDALGGSVGEEEWRAWEERTARALRAKEARGIRNASPPKRASRPEPRPSKLYAPEMECDAARDVRLVHGAARCFQLIYALQRGQLPRPTKRWLAEQLGVCTRTVQRYLKQLRLLGYITVDEIRTATGWMIGQIVRTTRKALPFFRREARRNPRNLGRQFCPPKQIPSVSVSTNEEAFPNSLQL